MRINRVASARKAPGSCSQCGRELGIGDGYKWIKPRHGSKRVRCLDCPTWRPSEMTTSSQLVTIYAAEESFGDECDKTESIEDLQSLLEEVAGSYREAGEMYREAAQNIEDGFGHSTYVSDELTEKADGCDGWADEVEIALDSVANFDEDVVREDVEGDVLQEMLIEVMDVDARPDSLEINTAEEASEAFASFDLEVYAKRVEEGLEEHKAEWLRDEAIPAAQEAVDTQPF